MEFVRFSREIIDELMVKYTESLREALGDNLKAVVLYGSCARGDNDEHSDIDVLVLVEDDDRSAKDSISRLESNHCLDYDATLCSTIRSFAWYTKYYHEPLYQNIRQEGHTYYGVA